MRRNRERAERHAIEDLSDAELVRRLRTMDRENRQQAPGKQHRWGKSQRRNARFVELLKALYEDRCQVCGQRIAGPGGRTRADVHHFEPRDGEASDRLSNVIVVCPNAHARFELGALRWTQSGLEAWEAGSWVACPLAVDRHLLVPLTASTVEVPPPNAERQ
jgi:predicted restriction endonuclease